MQIKVVYGTSDHLPNWGELGLTVWSAEVLGGQSCFFFYPKGPEWLSWEMGLFEPYEPPSSKADLAFAQAGFLQVEIFSLQQMAEGDLGLLTMGEVAEKIRSERTIKAFRAVNFLLPAKPVYVSSKDRLWPAWSLRTISSVLNDPTVKIGGAFIYFLYGAWAGRHRGEVVAILPWKEKPDVLDAFRAGEKWVGQPAQVFPTGEIDFMTRRQWSLYFQDRRWRKAPAWAFRRLLETERILEEVKKRLVVDKLYTPLLYDEKEDRFRIIVEEEVLIR